MSTTTTPTTTTPSWLSDLCEAVEASDFDGLERLVKLEATRAEVDAVTNAGEDWPLAASPMHKAAALGDNDAIFVLKTNGISVNAYASQKSPAGRLTPLHSAILTNQVKAVKLLLQLGASPDLPGSLEMYSGSAAEWAQTAQRRDIVNMLQRYESAKANSNTIAGTFSFVIFVIPILSFLFFYTLKAYTTS